MNSKVGLKIYIDVNNTYTFDEYFNIISNNDLIYKYYFGKRSYYNRYINGMYYGFDILVKSKK
jgi:hypothetical protein